MKKTNLIATLDSNRLYYYHFGSSQGESFESIYWLDCELADGRTIPWKVSLADKDLIVEESFVSLSGLVRTNSLFKFRTLARLSNGHVAEVKPAEIRFSNERVEDKRFHYREVDPDDEYWEGDIIDPYDWTTNCVFGTWRLCSVDYTNGFEVASIYTFNLALKGNILVDAGDDIYSLDYEPLIVPGPEQGYVGSKIELPSDSFHANSLTNFLTSFNPRSRWECYIDYHGSSNYDTNYLAHLYLKEFYVHSYYPYWFYEFNRLVRVYNYDDYALVGDGNWHKTDIKNAVVGEFGRRDFSEMLQSGIADNAYTNTLPFSVDGPGWIDFGWSANTLPSDRLEFWVDGEMIKSISGYHPNWKSDGGNWISGETNDWTRETFHVAGDGHHDVKFQFVKESDYEYELNWCIENIEGFDVSRFAGSGIKTEAYQYEGGAVAYRWAPEWRFELDAQKYGQYSVSGEPEGTNRFMFADSLPEPSRTHYKFAGWYTDPDGGVQFEANGGGGDTEGRTWKSYVIKDADGRRLSMSELEHQYPNRVIHLYGRWEVVNDDVYRVYFKESGDDEYFHYPGQEFFLDEPQALAPNAFTRDGYRFVGWARTPDGPAVWRDGDVIENLQSAGMMPAGGNSFVIYGVWAKGDAVLSNISYTNLCGARQLNGIVYEEGVPMALLPPGSRIGYSFAGWSPAAITPEMTGDLVVSATWRTNEYQIVYVSNGGSGVMEPTLCHYDQEGEIAGCSYLREGYHFKDWVTGTNGMVVSFRPGEKFLNLSAKQGDQYVLYARWEEDGRTDGDVVDESLFKYEACAGGVIITGIAQELYDATRIVVPEFINGLPVVSIGTLAFAGKSVQNVELPVGLKTIGSDAFYGCYSLSHIVVPSSVTNILSSAFYHCALASVDLPPELTAISSGTFMSCAKLVEVRFPAGITKIGPRAFSQTGLKYVELPYSVVGIDYYAFDGSALSSVFLHANLAIVGNYPFSAYGKVGLDVIVDVGDLTRMSELLTAMGREYKHVFRECDEDSTIEYLNDKGVPNVNPANYQAGWVMTFAPLESVPGYVFDRWSPAAITEEMCGPLVVTAKWSVATYKVRYEDNGGSGVMDDQQLSYGEEGMLLGCGFKKEGYSFVGWSLTVTGAIVYHDKEVVKNLSSQDGAIVPLYAQWAPNKYSVRFHGGEGATGTMNSQDMTYDVEALLNQNRFAKTGYVFKGWSRMEYGAVFYSDRASVMNLTAESNVVIDVYAQWSAIEYTVRFDANGGDGSMSGLALTYDVGRTLPTNAFARVGYVFSGWATSANGPVVYVDAASVKNLTSIQNRSVTLYAVWTPNTYEIDFNGGNGGTGSMDLQSMIYDEEMSLNANSFEKVGYTFIGWTDDEYELEEVLYYDGMIVSNLTAELDGVYNLYAVWMANEYSVRFEANGGEGEMAVQNFIYDEAQPLTVNAFNRNGFTFAGWTREIGSIAVYSDAVTVSNLTAEADGVVTLFACWSANPYVIAFDANGGDGVMMDIGCVYGKSETLPRNTFRRTGYRFAGWAKTATGPAEYKDGDSVSTLATSGTAMLYAKWELIDYEIVYDLGGGVNHADNLSSYTIEDGVILRDPAREGYRFVKWEPADCIVAGSVGERAFSAVWITEPCPDVVSGILRIDAALAGKAFGCLPELDAPAGMRLVGWTMDFESEMLVKPEDEIPDGGAVLYPVWERIDRTAEFAEAVLDAEEGSNVIVRVLGGNLDRTSSVKVYLKYTGAAAADIDITKTLVNGVAVNAKTFKFPVTLKWAAGEIGEKTITLKLKKDSLAEGPERFTLQLGGELGMALGEARTCTVAIDDTSVNPLKATVKNPSKTKGVKKFAIETTSADEETGLVSPGGTWYKGSKVTVKAKAKTGYAFAGWYDLVTGAKVSIAANYTFTVSKARTLEARFSKRYYVRALADPVDGATVTGSGWFANGKTATLKAVAKPHFKFLGWYAAKADDPNVADMSVKLSGSATYKPVVEGNLTVFACYQSEPRLEIFKSTGGTVSGANKYAAGKTATLKATVSKGYAFLGWYDDEGNLLSQATSYKYVMGSENTLLHAEFKKESALATPVLDWNAPTNLLAGVSYTAQPKVSGEAAVKIVSMSGLPAGLAYKSGKVSGAATTVKTNTVSVKVALNTNTKKVWTLKQRLVVEALPAWARGTYNGGAFSTPLQATVTVASSGKVSGKLNFANAVWTLSGTKYSALDAEAETATLSLTAKKGTTKKTVKVTIGADDLGGFAFSETAGFLFEARQNLWKTDPDWAAVAANLIGAVYTNEVDGLVVKFGANATATSVLKSGKNSFTGSAVLCPTEIGEGSASGKLYLYFAPNTKKKFKGAVKPVVFTEE